jgi:arginyl-tRNA--protein-N-Asp/Glu arginylyltransferase
MTAHHPGQNTPRHSLTDLAFYASAEHDCGYLEGQTAVTVFADPDAPMNMSTYSALAEIGFRRSGSHVYTPHCPNCQACVPARLPVAHFQPNRNQRRTLKRATDITAEIGPPRFKQEAFDLYQKYIATRHTGGGMDDPDPERYLDFLSCDWAETEFVEFRLHDRLIAVAVQDVLTRGLSAVYSFFDPDFSAVSLGRYALLWQIGEAQRRRLPWLFLGYWIANCKKMLYKQEYRPIELFQQGHWQRFDRDQLLPSP